MSAKQRLVILGGVKQTTGSFSIGRLILSGFALFALVTLRVLMAKDSEWRTSWRGTVQAETVERAPVGVKVAAGEATA